MTSWENLYQAESSAGELEPAPKIEINPGPRFQVPRVEIEVKPDAPSPGFPVLQFPPNAGPVISRPDQLIYSHATGEPPQEFVRFVEVGATSVPMEIARCAEWGFWWVGPREVPESHRGWAWENMVVKMRGRKFTPLFPDLTDTPGHYDIALAKALPPNDQWYLIGTVNGISHWARNDDGDVDFVTGNKKPEDE